LALARALAVTADAADGTTVAVLAMSKKKSHS